LRCGAVRCGAVRCDAVRCVANAVRCVALRWLPSVGAKSWALARKESTRPLSLSGFVPVPVYFPLPRGRCRSRVVPTQCVARGRDSGGRFQVRRRRPGGAIAIPKVPVAGRLVRGIRTRKERPGDRPRVVGNLQRDRVNPVLFSAGERLLERFGFVVEEGGAGLGDSEYSATKAPKRACKPSQPRPGHPLLAHKAAAPDLSRRPRAAGLCVCQRQTLELATAKGAVVLDASPNPQGCAGCTNPSGRTTPDPGNAVASRKDGSSRARVILSTLFTRARHCPVLVRRPGSPSRTTPSRTGRDGRMGRQSRGVGPDANQCSARTGPGGRAAFRGELRLDCRCPGRFADPSMPEPVWFSQDSRLTSPRQGLQRMGGDSKTGRSRPRGWTSEREPLRVLDVSRSRSAPESDKLTGRQERYIANNASVSECLTLVVVVENETGASGS